MDPTQYPALPVYAMFASGLCLFVMVLDGRGASVRAKTKTTLNKDDSSLTAGVDVVDEERTEVARANRVWRNAFANVMPFLVVAYLYVLTGATARNATIYFSVFSAARFLHAIVYAVGKQPWRAIFFTLGQAATLGLAVQVFRHFV